jgi:WXG100 family type VII secretion target
MSAPQVRSDYDQLNTIAQTFSTQSDTVNRTLQSVRSNMDTLQGGDWIGKGAQAFYKEMNDQVLPTMQRLQKALAEASRITKQIAQIMKQAEDEASGCFHI